jgi:hypothetical protein
MSVIFFNLIDSSDLICMRDILMNVPCSFFETLLVERNSMKSNARI